MALTNKLSAIANAIRSKTGKSATMTLDEMVTEINSISGGGGVLQELVVALKKQLRPTQPSSDVYTPDEGYDGFSSVEVPRLKTQGATVELTTSGAILTPDEGYDGFVTVSVPAVTGTALAALDSNFKAENIKKDVSVFGTVGTYEGGGSSSGWVLLNTMDLGTISTTSTTATSLGKSVTATGLNGYDLLRIDCVNSVTSASTAFHTQTTSYVLLSGSSNDATVNTSTIANAKKNWKKATNGTVSSRSSTSAYGVYVYTATMSSGTVTMPIYYRYNSTYTGTMNGTYTAKVYAIKL